MIYRTPDYHRLVSSLEKANKRLDKKKLEEPVAALKSSSTTSSSSSTKATKGKDKKGKDEGKQDKKLTMLEKEVDATNRDLTLFKMRANMATAFMHMLTFYSLKTNYEGLVIARLPFEPFAMIRGITHRGLEGDDYRECGVILVYIICSMAMKPNLQRVLGHAPPKTAMPKTIWGIPTGQ
uniref:Calcium load-activated calcium channel n=1 Tax=Prymnesium polylepis TaxID=72548 RepID=A0A7S4I6A2_9EUKA|mmetsp:Transcript_27118/g.67145  ORF Transcript_27118/g.67145 Transcript_27118/m.67145 type:complete len:180 (+) Transcript_27118:3-542(+)